MRSSDIRRLSAGCIVAVVLATVPAVRAQGPGSRPAGADAIVPFKIQVSDAVLTDLKRRLSQARFAEDFGDPGWDYGTNPGYLKQLVEYWRDKYDWRAAERKYNEYAQFTTNLDGLNIYFIHQRSRNPNALPLLLLNGWPSSIEEYMKVIKPLSENFHVVVPSMPGFGFSDKPKERGYHTERIAGVWVKLMARLGYSRYAVHGSDWGSQIATRVALNDPMHVAALHLAGCAGAPAAPAANAVQAAQPPAGPAPDVNTLVNGAHNVGYQEIQSTKPQTLGPGISDSPVGLASWILDKWYGWMDHDGDIEKVVTRDELLNNIMIYWVTNSGPSSARIYWEARHMNGFGPMFPRPEGRVAVPTGCGAFPTQYDRRQVPANTNLAEARQSAETRYNVVHYTQFPRGGHFPAFEQPTVWMDDLRMFLRDRN